MENERPAAPSGRKCSVAEAVLIITFNIAYLALRVAIGTLLTPFLLAIWLVLLFFKVDIDRVYEVYENWMISGSFKTK